MPAADYAALFNKVAFITGGSKGIGEGCARVFCDAGAHVIIGDLDEDRGRSLATALTERGPGTCYFAPSDVRDFEQLGNTINHIVQRYSRLDCLINNAGRHPPRKPVEEFTVEEFRDLLELNLIAYFVACRLTLPHLRSSSGSIINIGSIVGKLGYPGSTTYCATKAGVTGFTKALAIEEAKNGVRVNVILPGNIMTQARIDEESRMDNPKPFHDYAESLQWMGRSGTPEEVGHACLFLASDASRYITGIELIVGGGVDLGLGPKLYTSPG